MNLLIASTATTGAAATTAGSATALVWGIVLLGIAVLLLAIELFVPSGGLISVVAGVGLVGSVAAFFTYDATWGFAAAATYLLLSPLAAVAIFKFWTHSRLGRRLVLGGEDEDFDADAETAAAQSEQARKQRMAELAGMVGQEGVAETALRPVGMVRIDGRRLDALAESGVIDAGFPVIVVAVHDNQLKVRAVR